MSTRIDGPKIPTQQIVNLIQAELAKAAPAPQKAPDAFDPGKVYPAYMVVNPTPTFDRHAGLIQRIARDGTLGLREAKVVRELFNFEIEQGQFAGGEVKSAVRAYLNEKLGSLKMEKGAFEQVFGRGGPGYFPIVAMYMVLPPKP